MKAEEITVEAKAKLDVSRNTAEACLKLVEIYCNNNNVDILGRKNEDGTETFSFDDEEIRTEEYIRGYNQGTIDRAEELQKCREYGYNKAIDEFAEKIALEISESIIWGMLVDSHKYPNGLGDTSGKIVDYVIDAVKKVAEQMKGGGNSED